MSPNVHNQNGDSNSDEELKKELVELKEQLREKSKEIGSLKQKVSRNDKEIQELNQNVSQKENEIQDLNREVSQKTKEVKKLTKVVSSYHSALGEATNLRLSDNDKNNPINLKADIKSLQDSLDDYVTNCKGEITVDFDEVSKLLKNYGVDKQKPPVPLIKAVLQRHVIDKIYSYAKIYFDNPRKHYQKPRGIETNMHKQANELIELSKIFTEKRDGVDEITKVLHAKLRQLIYAALGNRGFNDVINSENNKIPHEFISYHQSLLNDEIGKYREHKDPNKKQEIERMAGDIIRKFTALIWFRLKVQDPIAEIMWFNNNDKIDPSYMEGRWKKDEIDKLAVDICYFPLIAQEFNDESKRCIYTPAKIFHKSNSKESN